MIRKDQFRVFQCSFCGNPDSLCMWNYYTKSNGVKGYNFGFGTSQLIDGISVEPEYEDKKPEVKFGKVIYSKAEQLEIVKICWNSLLILIKNMMVNLALSLHMLLGNYCNRELFLRKSVLRLRMNIG